MNKTVKKCSVLGRAEYVFITVCESDPLHMFRRCEQEATHALADLQNSGERVRGFWLALSKHVWWAGLVNGNKNIIYIYC